MLQFSVSGESVGREGERERGGGGGSEMEGRERGKEGLEEVASPYYSVLHASEL